jgi:hypothetical protein
LRISHGSDAQPRSLPCHVCVKKFTLNPVFPARTFPFGQFTKRRAPVSIKAWSFASTSMLFK